MPKNGEAIGVIDLTTGKINLIPTTHDTEITAQDNTSAGVESAKANLDTVKDKTVTLTVQTVQVGGLSNQKCSGGQVWQFGNVRKKKPKKPKVHKILRAVWQWLMMKRVYLTHEN